MSMFVCLYVCPAVRTHISETACPNFTEFSVHATMAVAWSSSWRFDMQSLLPVLWMTSCLRIMTRNRRRVEASVTGQVAALI